MLQVAVSATTAPAPDVPLLESAALMEEALFVNIVVANTEVTSSFGSCTHICIYSSYKGTNRTRRLYRMQIETFVSVNTAAASPLLKAAAYLLWRTGACLRLFAMAVSAAFSEVTKPWKAKQRRLISDHELLLTSNKTRDTACSLPCLK